MLPGTCGPFSDVPGDAFCPFVEEIFYLGITTGTTPTTYEPNSPVSRLQMAAFLSRMVDRVLQRVSPRAPLGRYWTPKNGDVIAMTTVGAVPALVRSDGADVWVANFGSGTVSRVRGSDGRLLETWTGASTAYAILVAMGRVFVAGNFTRSLFMINPSEQAGQVTTLVADLVGDPFGIAFDGARIWTANHGASGSVSIVTPGATTPWTFTTIATGFPTGLTGALYDGENIWVTDEGGDRLLRLSASGSILQTVTVGSRPLYPVFDGANLWVPNRDSNSITVVRSRSGDVLTTLTGNGLNGPFGSAFDGQRVLITNVVGNSLSLWRASDLAPLGSVGLNGVVDPAGACSDGRDFWITLFNGDGLIRY